MVFIRGSMRGVPPTLRTDSFLAAACVRLFRGHNDQLVAMLPEEDLVVVRLGATLDDSWDTERFLQDVLSPRSSTSERWQSIAEVIGARDQGVLSLVGLYCC